MTVLPVDPEKLRDEIKDKYRAVAVAPHATYHFHTGRIAAERFGYDRDVMDGLPVAAGERNAR